MNVVENQQYVTRNGRFLTLKKKKKDYEDDYPYQSNLIVESINQNKGVMYTECGKVFHGEINHYDIIRLATKLDVLWKMKVS